MMMDCSHLLTAAKRIPELPQDLLCQPKSVPRCSSLILTSRKPEPTLNPGELGEIGLLFCSSLGC